MKNKGTFTQSFHLALIYVYLCKECLKTLTDPIPKSKSVLSSGTCRLCGKKTTNCVYAFDGSDVDRIASCFEKRSSKLHTDFLILAVRAGFSEAKQLIKNLL